MRPLFSSYYRDLLEISCLETVQYLEGQILNYRISIFVICFAFCPRRITLIASYFLNKVLKKYHMIHNMSNFDLNRRIEEDKILTKIPIYHQKNSIKTVTPLCPSLKGSFANADNIEKMKGVEMEV